VFAQRHSLQFAGNTWKRCQMFTAKQRVTSGVGCHWATAPGSSSRTIYDCFFIAARCAPVAQPLIEMAPGRAIAAPRIIESAA
jgi:hypothetical protein